MGNQSGTSKFTAGRLYILSGLLLLAIVAALAWQTSGPGEPVYEGKPISHWLAGHVASSAANPRFGSPGWKKADEILRRAGTNAIPTMLKMIRAKDPPGPALKVMEFFRRRNWLFKSYRNASTRNEEARYAFEVLGPSAAAAVPKLIKIYEQNISPSSKRCVASALGTIGKAAQPAIPVLLNDFTNADRQVRFDAVSAVLHIGGDPKILIPALQSMLKDPMHEIRANAAVALDINFAGRARSTVPDLLWAIDDLDRSGDAVQKGMVEDSLWGIAPEADPKRLVVGDAEPIRANGVTTEALDVQFNAERRTLLPAGKRLPCAAQFWTAPTGPLTLYRISVGNTKEEHWLGDYEVVGIKPPPNEGNVSLLIVVTDKNILLCARENDRHEFMEIRRIK
jgi:hypothetical protein